MAWTNILDIVAETASSPNPVSLSLDAGFEVDAPYVQTTGYPSDIPIVNGGCGAGLFAQILGLAAYFAGSVNVRATVDGVIFNFNVDGVSYGDPACTDEIDFVNIQDPGVTGAVIEGVADDPSAVSFAVYNDGSGTDNGHARLLIEIEDWPGMPYEYFWTDYHGSTREVES